MSDIRKVAKFDLMVPTNFLVLLTKNYKDSGKKTSLLQISWEKYQRKIGNVVLHGLFVHTKCMHYFFSE